jgi:hypothetical protein
MRRRPYVFEIVVLLNVAWVFRITFDNALATLPTLMLGICGPAVIMAAGCILVRCLIAWRRGNLRHYAAILRSRAWLTDSFRILISLGLLATAYAWIKLLVPVLHPHLFDQALFDLDRKLCFGIAPTVFVLNLFSDPHFLHFIDQAYVKLFFGGIFLSYGIIFSAPSRRVRVTYMTSTALMWITGAWLYMLIPSLGPAYGFADIWLPYSRDLYITHNVQATLMRNYRAVHELAAGGHADVSAILGIAAFPSLHVAAQTLVAIWLRRIWPAGQLLFGVAAFVVFIGSMITGWHYLVDGLAGFALAAGAYWGAKAVAKKEFRPSRSRF